MTESDTSAPIPSWHHLPENPYNPHAWVVGEPTVGQGTWIGAFTVIDGSGGLTIGENCDISAGAQIYTHSTVRRCLNKSIDSDPEEIERAATKIGTNVHIGAGAIILMGCAIGNHCVIAAGAVVSQFTVVPDHSVVAGIPGKIIPDAANKFITTHPTG